MNIDVAKEYDLLLQLFKDYKPDTVMNDALVFYCAGSLDCLLLYYYCTTVRTACSISDV